MEVDSSSEDDWVPLREQQQQKKKQITIIDSDTPQVNNQFKSHTVKCNFARIMRKEEAFNKKIKDVGDQMAVDDNNQDNDEEGDGDESQEIFEEQGLKELKQQIKQEAKMFNPCEDEMSEEWVNRYLRNVPKGMEDQLQSITLSCPGCFTDICYECQPHDSYKNQYRAFQVYNCEINQDRIIDIRQLQPNIKDRLEANTENGIDMDEFWFEVKCKVCGNQVGLYQYDNKGSYYGNDSFKSCYHLFF